MQLGIHLPHAGEQATPALIRRHAMRAEALGFDDVWVSEHIIVPRKRVPALAAVLRSGGDAELGRRGDRARAARHHRAGAADAPSAAAGEGAGEPAQPVRADG